MEIYYTILFFIFFFCIVAILAFITYNHSERLKNKVIKDISSKTIIKTGELICYNWSRGFHAKNYTFKFCELHFTHDYIYIQFYDKMLGRTWYHHPVYINSKTSSIINNLKPSTNIRKYNLKFKNSVLHLKLEEQNIFTLNIAFKIKGFQSSQIETIRKILESSWSQESDENHNKILS